MINDNPLNTRLGCKPLVDVTVFNETDESLL
jgi:hypothetical protein